MSWFTDIFSGGAKGIVDGLGGIIDKFKLAPGEKEQFRLEAEALLQKRDSEIETTLRRELEAKERVLVAELQQGDNFTKRARPSVVYVGLAAVVFNYCVIPTILTFTGHAAEPFELPTAFWAGWSGIVATWQIGRTMEKRGANNRFTRAVTGSDTTLLE